MGGREDEVMKLYYNLKTTLKTFFHLLKALESLSSSPLWVEVMEGACQSKSSMKISFGITF